MNAQNPSAEWVMLFKYPIITEAISKDGSGFIIERGAKNDIIRIEILLLNQPFHPF